MNSIKSKVIDEDKNNKHCYRCNTITTSIFIIILFIIIIYYFVTIVYRISWKAIKAVSRTQDLDRDNTIIRSCISKCGVPMCQQTRETGCSLMRGLEWYSRKAAHGINHRSATHRYDCVLASPAISSRLSKPAWQGTLFTLISLAAGSERVAL